MSNPQVFRLVREIADKFGDKTQAPPPTKNEFRQGVKIYDVVTAVLRAYDSMRCEEESL